MMLLANQMYIALLISAITSSLEKQEYKEDKIETIKEDETIYDNTNPIRSVSFFTLYDSHFINLILNRQVSTNHVYIMRSTNPDDVNSFVISTDIGNKVRFLPGLRMKIPLEDCDINNKKLVFSIQIREGMNIHQTEPFYYENNENKFMLLREKSNDPFMDTETIIYICMGVFGTAAVFCVGYALFVKKP